MGRAVVLGLLLLAGAAPAVWADALEDALLTTDGVPGGWQLIDQQRAPNLETVPEAQAAVRQRWSYRGDRFAVIYFLCPDLARATALYERHVRTLGARAIVAPRGTVVVELHDAPAEVWPDAVALLGWDEAQWRKLVAAALPQGWNLKDEFLAPPEAVAAAGDTLHAPIQSILVQVVDSPHGTVRVNFMLCADRDSAAEIYTDAAPKGQLTSFITLDGPVIIEIIADDQSALLPALEVVEAAPLLSRAPAS